MKSHRSFKGYLLFLIFLSEVLRAICLPGYCSKLNAKVDRDESRNAEKELRRVAQVVTNYHLKE